MKQRIAFGITLLLIVALGAAVGATQEGSVRYELASSVADLSDLLDRALYLAIAGFSAYDSDDQLVAAQGLINLFEGPGGANYDDSLGEVDGEGMLFSSALSQSRDWIGLLEELRGSEVYSLRVAAGNIEQFLRLAYYAALEARDTVYSLLGAEDAFRAVYAHLVAARGGFDDPFLVEGIHQLVTLFPLEGTQSPSAVVRDNELQELLQVASAGEIIHLKSGVYRGRPSIIMKDVTIKGISPAETILEGVAWDTVVAIIAETSVNVMLQDMTIRGGSAAIASQAYDDKAHVTLTVTNVVFEENQTGVSVGRGTDLLCSDCRFNENGIAVAAWSPLEESSRIELVDCVFDENERAIEATGNQTITLDNCSILNGTDPRGDIEIGGLALLEMRDSELRRVTGRGIVLMDTASMTLVDNVIETADSHAIAVASTRKDETGRIPVDCGVFMGTNAVEFRLGTITGYANTISGGICPTSLLFLADPAPAEVTVEPGESIQDAIDIVADGGAIYIERGEYREVLTIGRSVQLIAVPEAANEQPVGVSLLGELGDTMISITSLEAIEVAIHGISLRGGARGIDVKENVSVSLDEMAFTELGTALTITYGASVQADNCTFSDNTSAVRAYFGASCTLRDSLIERCTTDESSLAVQNAISAYCSDLVLENCTIRDNQGSGVKLGGGETSRLHMVNCFITGNAYGLELEYGSCNPGSDPNWEPPTHPGFKSHGTISGWGNTIPGPDEPKGNSEAAIDYYYKSFIDPWFLTEPAPAELLVEPGQSIQAAIDSATDGDTIVIGEGTYRENLAIEKPLTLLGVGEVTIIPVDQENPAIQIAETEGVVIQGIQIESAVTGIDMVQASCRIVDCLFRDTDVGVRAVTMDFDVVRIQQCTFIGETAGVGIQVNGSGTIEIENCDFDGLGTGAILSGMTSVLVDDCTFRDCYDGIVLASSVEGTLTGNEIDGSGGSGIRVAAVPVPPVLVPSGVLDDLLTDVTLTLVDNVIQNSWRWGLSFCDTADPEVVAFKGTLLGSGNQIDNMNPLCLVDYEWPEGFFANE